MKFSDFDQPASSSAVDAIQAAYTATFYLYRQTPRWRLLLRARLLRQYEMYLKLLVKAIDSRRDNSPALLTVAQMIKYNKKVDEL